MTRIDFYILEPEGAGKGNNARQLFACRLAEKAFSQGHRVYIHTGSAAEAEQIDDLLWTFKQNSFIPHGRIDDEAGADEDTPVHIGHGEDAGSHDDVLINLGTEVPLFFSRFQRVAELVDPQGREPARQRYSFYRDRGYPLDTHNL